MKTYQNITATLHLREMEIAFNDELYKPLKEFMNENVIGENTDRMVIIVEDKWKLEVSVDQGLVIENLGTQQTSHIGIMSLPIELMAGIILGILAEENRC